MRKCDHRPEEEGDMTRVTTQRGASANHMAMIPPPGSIPHTVLRGGHSWGALPVGDGAPEGSLISSSRSTMSSLAVY